MGRRTSRPARLDGSTSTIAASAWCTCPATAVHAWYVVDDECSHADYSLSEGDVWVEECEIECPKHGSTFSLVSGEPQTLPATRPVAVYPVRVVDDDVMVTLP